jgi:2-methylcitrate dehydratase PrpD
LLRERGGPAQATVLVWGDKLPASSAAYLNGVMARALDYCDAMAPGIHIGSSLVPAALAAAELAGGCSGEEFLTALCAGAEISSRLNLAEDQYAGFDPTGVAAPFAATAAAARLLRLTPQQTLHAMALAFNRSGGSFQSNVDGSLAVRFIQGWVAETAIHCVELARAGITGPRRWLSGVYGYATLYGRGRLDPDQIVQDLGERWAMEGMMFKRYPSCGVTQGVTNLTLRAMRDEGLRAADVDAIEVRLPPYAHRLVGNAFRLGDNPRVDAQFSAQFCVANALHRESSRLEHFTPQQVVEPAVAILMQRIRVVADPAMDQRGHSSVDLQVTTSDGRTRSWGVDIAPGYPGQDLKPDEHLARFQDCMDYAAVKLAPAQQSGLLSAVDGLEELKDVRELLPLLIAR